MIERCREVAMGAARRWVFLVCGALAAVSVEARADDAADAADADREILGVEQQVNELKERVFRSKATLQLLRELVLEGSGVGTRLVLLHEEKLASSYVIESVQIFLDGKTVYARSVSDGEIESEEIKVLERSLPAGSHEIMVNYTMRGNGYGVFSYLNDYKFRLQSTYEVEIPEGKKQVVKIELDEKGGMVKRYTKRPSVSYELRSEEIRSE
jgi:hypothetical protein